MKVSKIILYDEPSVVQIQINDLKEFLEKTLKIKTEIRNNIFNISSFDYAEKVASCRVLNPYKPFSVHMPTLEEINFEKKNFENTNTTENIVMYDGFELQKLFLQMIPEKEQTSDIFHIIFTNKLTCTFDDNDYRYHGRALIASNPSIISTTGIIEAPAKPREYYVELISNIQRGLNLDAIKQKYKGQYLEYHDDLLGRVVCGYALQALFYYYTGEPFCEDKNCMLFNAHWQKDLLYSQITSGKLCNKHQSILNSIPKYINHDKMN